MVVSELVRQNRAHLVHRQDLHERKTEAHNAPASNSHEAAALGDPSVDIRNQISVPWWILPSCFSHRIEPWKGSGWCAGTSSGPGASKRSGRGTVDQRTTPAPTMQANAILKSMPLK